MSHFNREKAKNVAVVILLLLGLWQKPVEINAQRNSYPVCPMGKEWNFCRDFSDEFNGTGLDRNKWMDLVPVWYGRKPSLFSAANVKVADGVLQLVCDEQKPDEVTYENKVQGFDKFRIAIAKSKNRIRYGYFEARCKSMKANVCNAFWLYDPLDPPAKYLSGDFSEEIDIFEIIGKPSPEYHESKDRIYSTTVHRFVTPYLEGVVNHNRPPLPMQGAKQRVPFDFSSDFHVYAFLWTPAEMKWFIDGREVFNRNNDYFKRALHIVFDCETLWGIPDSSDLPAVFNIDYIRVWQYAGNSYSVAH